MPISILFWVLYLLAVVFCFVGAPAPFTWRGSAGTVLLLALLGLLGWKCFGAAVT